MFHVPGFIDSHSGFRCNVSEIWISRFVYLENDAIFAFRRNTESLTIRCRRMIKLMLYCYQVIFYFFSKLTGKSGTSLSKIF